MMKIHCFVLLAAFSLVSFAGADETTQVTREYRPLEAKKVSIQPAARVRVVESPVSAGDFRKLAWKHFDERKWEAATDAFLSSLEKDSESVEAGEGLAMSVLHSGDYASAFRLGQELEEVMPSVRRIISETILADVRFMIRKGEFDAAREFLAHFPSSEPCYAEAHELVGDAATITTALGPDGDVSTDPAAGKGQRVAKN